MAASSSQRGMLQSNSLILFLLLGSLLLLGAHLVLRMILLPEFEDFERASARTKLSQLEGALQRSIRSLSFLTWEYAYWDDTYQHIQTPVAFADLIEQYMTDDIWQEAEIELVLFFNKDAELVWGKWRHPKYRNELPTEALVKRVRVTPQLIKHDSSESLFRGYMITSAGIMLVSSSPIMKSDESGPIRGSAIFGRFITADRATWMGVGGVPEVAVFPAAT